VPAAAGGRRRARGRVDYWPGFVDALSTLLLVFTFLTSVFMLAQFFLAQELTGRDTVLSRLNRQILELTELLSLERTGRSGLDDQIASLSASLEAAEAERTRLRGELESARAGAAGDASGRIAALAREAEDQRRISDRALAQVELLNQQLAALRRQIAAVEQALAVSETRETESQTRIADLGRRLNVALAQRVQELSRYRSDFFGRLREILSSRADIRIVGDRFVFSSELFFDPGSADLKPEALPELEKLATALIEIGRQIPADIPWALRVDGHTDRRPISNVRFPSNWELSASRAISVVRYLISRGIAAERLVAAGFGEFQPIDPNDTPEALARNRRIELRLTDR
jgi:chemotaxis protein MotB